MKTFRRPGSVVQALQAGADKRVFRALPRASCRNSHNPAVPSRPGVLGPAGKGPEEASPPGTNLLPGGGGSGCGTPRKSEPCRVMEAPVTSPSVVQSLSPGGSVRVSFESSTSAPVKGLTHPSRPDIRGSFAGKGLRVAREGSGALVSSVFGPVSSSPGGPE